MPVASSATGLIIQKPPVEMIVPVPNTVHPLPSVSVTTLQLFTHNHANIGLVDTVSPDHGRTIVELNILKFTVEVPTIAPEFATAVAVKSDPVASVILLKLHAPVELIVPVRVCPHTFSVKNAFINPLPLIDITLPVRICHEVGEMIVGVIH